ncbi:MAG: DUF1573 domain-containing protein [Planctomycetota bacterium]
MIKSLLITTLVAAALGYGLGAVVAYVEVPSTLDQPKIEKPRADFAGDVPQIVSYPKAELPETVFEFGNIERGTSMSHEFLIRNVGDKPLHVEVASTTCKCTVGDLSDSDIEPGAETKVMLEWVAKTPPGPFRHGAVLSTNDPTQSSINLTVEGQVVDSTAMSPAELIFGTVRAGEGQTASLYLMQFLDQDIEVTDYELSDPELAEQLEIEITEANPSELPSPDAVRGLLISARYTSGKTVGPFQCWLTIKTNLKNAEQLSIPIAGNVVGDVSIFHPGWNAQKGILRMGTFPSQQGKRVKATVAIRGEQGTEAKLEIAEVDPPELKASLGEPRAMGTKLTHIPLILEVPAGTPPLVRLGEPISSDAHVLLRSDTADIPTVRMKVHFAVE